MSDIVERLYRGEGCLEEGGKTCISMDASSGCICAIAADTITRLTAEVERLRVALQRVLSDVDFMVESDIIPDIRDDFIYTEAHAALEGKQ